MKLIIEHKHTKREINGPFALCCSKDDLIYLHSIIESKLEQNFSYGWIRFDVYTPQPDDSGFEVMILKRQKTKANTEPVNWD